MDQPALRSTRTPTSWGEVHALVGGTPDAGDVVIAPGLGVSRYLRASARAIAAHGFRCWLVDPPGFGDSGDPPPDRPPRLGIAEIAAVMSEWLAARDLTGVTALGHSSGTQVAARLASRADAKRLGGTKTAGRADGPRLAGGTETAGRADGPGLAGGAEAAGRADGAGRAEVGRPGGRTRVARLVLASPTLDPHLRPVPRTLWHWFLDNRREPPSLSPSHRPEWRRAGLRRLIHLMRSMLTDDLGTSLRYVDCPVLVVRGTADPLCTRRWAYELTEGENRTLRELPGLPHAFPYQEPGALADALAEEALRP